MSKTLLDYDINPTPYPIQASPSTGDPSKASLSLVVSNHSHHIITCSKIALGFRTGGNAEDFCSDATGISSSPQTGWSVQQQGGLFTFTPDTNDKGQVGGDGLVFELKGIKVNQEPGPFQITLDEEASDSDASPPAPDQIRSRSWERAKFPAQFTVGDLNADPLIVESGGSTTLSWSGSGSSGNYTALYEIQYAGADGNKVTIDHPKGQENQPLPAVGGYTVDGLKATTTFYLLVTVQIQGSNNPLRFTRENTVTVTAPHPPKPTVTSYTGELQPDGSLLLKWTTQPDHDVTVTLKPALSSEVFVGNGQHKVEKPPLPLLHNYLYALTATLGEKSDIRVFTTCQKFGIVRPAIDVGHEMWDIAVSPDSSHVFVTNPVDHIVSIIEVNLANEAPFRVLPTTLGMGTGRQTMGIAVSPDGKHVFVENYNDQRTIDSSVMMMFGGTPPFQPVSEPVRAGLYARDVVVSHDGRYVFVPNNQGGEANLSVIDTANAPSFEVTQGPTVGNSIRKMATSPDGLYVFLVDNSAEHYFSANSLSIVQIEAGANPPYKVLPSLPVGDYPIGVAVSPDSHYVFVANRNSDSVSVIEVSSGPSFQVLSPPVGAGHHPVNLTVSPDGRFLFVNNDGGVLVCVIDKNSHPPVQPLQTLSVWDRDESVEYQGISASPDGNFIFVANVGEGTTILVIEPVVVSM